MTSAQIDTRSGLPALSRDRDLLSRTACRIAAQSRAQVLANWLRIAGRDDMTDLDADVALSYAGQCASDLIDFAIVAGDDPIEALRYCRAELGGQADAARAMIEAQLLARSTRHPNAEVAA